MNVAIADELKSHDQEAVIKVCGVGGGGGNAITRMIEEGMQDVEFIAINTDAQALKRSPAGIRLQVGNEITHGLGSGAVPEIGQKSATHDRERISDVMAGADMVFVTAGLGGGTGTGAAPIVAEIARSSGALTVGIVTLPFSFEGKARAENARAGLEALEKEVDTLIVVPNDRVARICQNDVSFLDAFRQADGVLHNGVRAISDLITIPGLINLDFADVRTIMQARGRALMGIGIAEGENRATRAAAEAIVCPLLEQSNINGAMGVIANVKGGIDLRMQEVEEAVSAIQKAAHPDANIIFGTVIHEEERQDIQVTVIAAGFQSGVSETFLEEESDLNPPRVMDVSPDGRIEPIRSDDSSSVQSDAQPIDEPKVEYLFPQDEPEATGTPDGEEPDEDLSIPAFMRRRKRTP